MLTSTEIVQFGHTALSAGVVVAFRYSPPGIFVAHQVALARGEFGLKQFKCVRGLRTRF
jgi:hypothetical protein